MKSMGKKMDNIKVFVYGTLKKGHSLSGYLRESKFLGDAETLPKFVLYSLGGCPALVRLKEGGHRVKGELYKVNTITLRNIDSAEGVYFGMYTRELITVYVNNKPTIANTYIWHNEIPKYAYPIGKEWKHDYGRNQ